MQNVLHMAHRAPGKSPYFLTHGEIGLRLASIDDARTVARALRPEDLLDIRAITRESPESSILSGLAQADRKYAIDLSGQCVAVGGVKSIDGMNLAVIWLLGTPGFDETIRIGGWRVCRSWLEFMSSGFRSVHNFVPQNNRKSIRWLKWMGFRTGRTIHNFKGLGKDCDEFILDLK